MENNEKTVEIRLRRMAVKLGLKIEKSRTRYASINNFGGFRIIDSSTDTLIEGINYELSLADVNHFLNEKRHGLMKNQSL